jgi:molybdopterin-guanine dinucleotide biosynthesis protein
MIQVQITGPIHSGKGYLMVEIARKLRELGCIVDLQGEETHLVDKTGVSDETAAARLAGQHVVITELTTSNKI